MCDDVLDDPLYADMGDCESPYIEDEWPSLAGVKDAQRIPPDLAEAVDTLGYEDGVLATIWIKIEQFRILVDEHCNKLQVFAAEHTVEDMLAMSEEAERVLQASMELWSMLELVEVREIVVTPLWEV